MIDDSTIMAAWTNARAAEKTTGGAFDGAAESAGAETGCCDEADEADDEEADEDNDASRHAFSRRLGDP